MNHGSSGNQRSRPDADDGLQSAMSAASERMSGTMQRSDLARSPADEGILLNLALYFCCDPSPFDAIRAALDALAEMLMDCSVSVHGIPGFDAQLTSIKRSHSAITARNELETKGCSAWILSDHPDNPTLLISLDNARSPREAIRRLSIGEQVVTLLQSAFRRHRSSGPTNKRAEEFSRLLERILQTEKLSQFGQSVAGVIHDLNNPLTAILSYSDYLCRSLAAQNVAASDLERLQRIREAAERVHKHTRSLVEYARPSGSQLVEVDLGRLVQNALIFCEHELARAKVQSSISCEELTRPILGISGQLTQLFVNLITNAAHAARPLNAELRVECGTDEATDFAVVEVSDNGTGIRAEDLERIFDPFFTTKSEGRGFGLGLSIVREIVYHHGGQIRVDSQLDVGTTFSIRLPTAPAPVGPLST